MSKQGLRMPWIPVPSQQGLWRPLPDTLACCRCDCAFLPKSNLGASHLKVFFGGLCLTTWLAAGALPPAEEWDNNCDQPFWQRWEMLALGFAA